MKFSMTSHFEEEIESLKTPLTRFMSSAKGCLRDIDTDLSTLENNHQVWLYFVFDEVVVLWRLVCSSASTSGTIKGRPNKIKVLVTEAFVSFRNVKELENFIWVWSSIWGLLIFQTAGK